MSTVNGIARKHRMYRSLMVVWLVADVVVVVVVVVAGVIRLWV